MNQIYKKAYIAPVVDYDSKVVENKKLAVHKEEKQISNSNCGTSRCKQCNKPLTQDERAIYLRMVNRGAKEYLCIPCLAEFFKCSIGDIEKRIVLLKEMGCTLFSK